MGMNLRCAKGGGDLVKKKLDAVTNDSRFLHFLVMVVIGEGADFTQSPLFSSCTART